MKRYRVKKEIAWMGKIYPVGSELEMELTPEVERDVILQGLVEVVRPPQHLEPIQPPQEERRQLPTSWTVGEQRSIGSLGERLDGWADLIEEAGDKFEAVVSAFQQHLLSRQVPEVEHEAATLTTGGMFSKQRPFQLTLTRTGATMAVYIGKFGRDLYVSWELFIRPLWNDTVIVGIICAAILLGLMFSTSRNPFTGHTEFSFVNWIIATIVLSLCFAVLVAMAGSAVKHNPLGFLIKELDAFDADDIGATMLAVHKSLLHAIDSTGIDIKLLRAKEQFRAGKRDRLI